MIKKIEIREHQKPHHRKLVQMASTNFGYVDNSDTGTGKTPNNLAIAITFGLSIFVVAPKSTLENWRRMAKLYGVKIEKIISYSSL